MASARGAYQAISAYGAIGDGRTGRVEQAAELVEELLSYTNSLGFLPEEINPDTGEYLGNYPQALSHIALINAAQALAEVAG